MNHPLIKKGSDPESVGILKAKHENKKIKINRGTVMKAIGL